MRSTNASATRALVAAAALTLLVACGAQGSITAPPPVGITTAAIPSASPAPPPTLISTTRRDPLAPDLPLRANVLSVYDGDTLRVMYRGESTQVRILGVQAPELANANLGIEAGCWGTESAEALKALLPQGTEVTLTVDPGQGTGEDHRDKYDRLLRYVEVKTQEGTTDVGENQLRSGNATVYEEYPTTRTEFYRLAQDAAQSDSAGLWAACPR